MDALTAVLIIIVMLGLRFGFPLLATFGLGRFFNILSERWHFELR